MNIRKLAIKTIEKELGFTPTEHDISLNAMESFAQKIIKKLLKEVNDLDILEVKEEEWERHSEFVIDDMRVVPYADLLNLLNNYIKPKHYKN